MVQESHAHLHLISMQHVAKALYSLIVSMRTVLRVTQI